MAEHNHFSRAYATVATAPLFFRNIGALSRRNRQLMAERNVSDMSVESIAVNALLYFYKSTISPIIETVNVGSGKCKRQCSSFTVSNYMNATGTLPQKIKKTIILQQAKCTYRGSELTDKELEESIRSIGQMGLGSIVVDKCIASVPPVVNPFGFLSEIEGAQGNGCFACNPCLGV